MTALRVAIRSAAQGFFIGACLSLLVVAPMPARAQPGTPTPAAPTGQVASAIEQTNAILQQQGAVTVFAVLFVLVVLVFAWVAIKPTIANNTASNNALIQSSNQHMLLTQEYQRVTVQHLEVDRAVQNAIVENTHTLILLNQSNTALIQSIADERQKGVEAVTEFAREQHEETRRQVEQAVNAAVGKIEERVDKALSKLDEILPRIDERLRAQDDTIRITLLEIQNELKQSKAAAQEVKHDTGKLTPPSETPTGAQA